MSKMKSLLEQAANIKSKIDKLAKSEELFKDVGRITFPKIDPKLTRPDQEVTSLKLRSGSVPTVAWNKAKRFFDENAIPYSDILKTKTKNDVSESINKLKTKDGGFTYSANPTSQINSPPTSYMSDNAHQSTKEHEGFHYLVDKIAKDNNISKNNIYRHLNKHIHGDILNTLKEVLKERGYEQPLQIVQESVPVLRDLITNKSFRDQKLKHLSPAQQQAFMTKAKISFRNIRDAAHKTTLDHLQQIQKSEKFMNDYGWIDEFGHKLKAFDLIKSEQLPKKSITDIANEYNTKKGLPNVTAVPPTTKIDTDYASKVAGAFNDMKHEPNHPKVKQAYSALINETADQFKHIMNTGLKISRITPDMANPYKSSKEMQNDVINNNHMWYFPTDQGFGSNDQFKDHPLNAPTLEKHGEHTLLANDMFRIVHDYFGHAKDGTSFGPKGEESAFRAHKQMFSPLAQEALASETRGQNSFVNFGVNGEHNRRNPDKTIYADQKAGLLPKWAQENY